MDNRAISGEIENQRTELWPYHLKLHAKFTPFAGWEMPVSYAGVIEEHRAVREAAGLFDVSHMGEIEVKGVGATAFMQFATTNDISALSPGKAQYGFLLNERGGVVDDIITYCFSDTHYLICVNASNVKKDYEWLLGLKTEDVEIVNRSSEYGQVALQGPKASEILTLLHPKPCNKHTAIQCKEPDVDLSLRNFPCFTFRELCFEADGQYIPMIVARTGYTGEDGFEIFVDKYHVTTVFDALLEHGEPLGLKPIGLGARDTLRLEAALPLYGHELRDDIPVLASGFGWAVKLKKGPFVGRDALLALQAVGAHAGLAHCDKKLVGFRVCDKGIVRADAPIFADAPILKDTASGSETDAREVGFVTSGTHAPYLGYALGLAYIEVSRAAIGTRLKAEVRGKLLEIEVCATPFYKRKKN